MNILRNKVLTGYIFSWLSGKEFDFNSQPEIEEVSSETDWTGLRLTTHTPLLSNDDLLSSSFNYYYLLKSYEQHVILVSNHSKLVDDFIRICKLKNMIKPPKVDVDRLMRDISLKPHEYYTISRVYASVDGFARRLRAISLFGDDLVQAEAFQNLLPNLTAQRIELRDVKKRISCLSIDGSGSIDFYFSNNLSLKLMLMALSFLSTGRLPSTYENRDKAKHKMKMSISPYIEW